MTASAAEEHSRGEKTGEPESLRHETRAAAGAVAGHFRKVLETASTEAELSVTSVVTMAAAALVSLLLAMTAWLCLVAAAIWLAIENGVPVVSALLVAGIANIAAVVGLLLWSKSLSRNLGFARTRRLVFPQSR